MKFRLISVALLLSILGGLWLLKWPVQNTELTQKAKIVKSDVKSDKSFFRSRTVSDEQGHNPEPEEASEIIYKITDRYRDFSERTKDILALRKMNLSKADEEELLNHLKTPHKDEVYTVKNDMIEHMVRYGSDQRKVGKVLLEIINDDKQSRVMREYVLQYIPEYYQSRWKAGKDWDDVDEQDRILFNETMWEVIGIREGSIAGGSLFALHRLAPKYMDINEADVYSKAHEVLIDPSYMNPNRMASVQILAFSQKEDYFDTAKQIVLEKQGPVLLQITAIHTAAQSKFLDNRFHNYLRDISSGRIESDPSLKKCAQLTLKKLNR